MKPVEMNLEMPEYNIIKHYLTLAEVENIARGMVHFDSWAEREQSKIAMVIYYMTDMETETIEAHSIDEWVESGEYSKIVEKCQNYSDIDAAVEFVESVPRNLNLVLKKAGPQINATLDALVKKYGNKVTK